MMRERKFQPPKRLCSEHAPRPQAAVSATSKYIPHAGATRPQFAVNVTMFSLLWGYATTICSQRNHVLTTKSIPHAGAWAARPQLEVNAARYDTKT